MKPVDRAPGPGPSRQAEAVAVLTAPVQRWLAGRSAAEVMDREYWRVRRANFEQLSSLPAEAQRALSAIDVALDAYWPDDDPDRPASPFSITEGRMRSEVEVALARLRALDLLED